MSDPAPRTIIADKYELVRELARGGMGAVWLARDLGLDRDVALKLILAEGADSAGTRERFAREARSLASLSSRHVVHVFDFGTFGASPFLVMELLRGEDLGARVKQRHRLPLPEAARIGGQIAKALTVAHERGLVHRDLKPGNVFLAQADGEEVVKVLDFGIAKSLAASEGSPAGAGGDLTRTGAVVGTPQYMSPEQFRSAKRVDHRSDLWSLGVVLFRCLTGAAPFNGDSLGDIVLAIAAEPIPVPSSVLPGLSPAVDAFFDRALQRDPAQRFQSARDMADALAELAGASPPPRLAEPTRADTHVAPNDGATWTTHAAAAAAADTVHAVPAKPSAPDAPTPSARPTTGGARSGESTPLTLPDRPSIAVLPFQNMSGDPEQDYFADGMVEELITGLSRLRWLFVISRQSTQVYKGRATDVRRVATELGVRYVLEGSVRKAGQRVRITGQLVEAATGAQLWAERYDGALADVFELQDRITESVVGAIEPSVQKAEMERSRRKHPDNLDAYDLVLRAIPFTEGHSVAASNQALPLLEQALALAPDYALAHAYASFVLEQRFMRGGFDPATLAASVKHAREAIAKGPDDATALTLGGFVLGMIGGDPEGSIAALDGAITLNPSSATAHTFSSVMRVFQGDFERGVEHAQRAIRLSPLDTLRAPAFISIAYAHFWSERYAEAAASAEKSAVANPRFPPALYLLIASRTRLGQTSQAKTALARLLEIEPAASVQSLVKTYASIGVRADRAETVIEALREAGLPT